MIIRTNTTTNDISVAQLDLVRNCQWSVHVIDPGHNSVAVHQISALLMGSTDEYKESRGGHVPDWVVRDIIHRYYTTVEAVQKTFASTGVRLALIGEKIDKKNAELFATILVARQPDVIFIKDSQHLNVSLSADSLEMPSNYHHCINFVTNMAYRHNGFGHALLQHIIQHASDYNFQGRGLCIRVDPPLISAFARLHRNFVHQYQYDQFFPDTGVQLPAGCSHPWLFNQQFLCPCHRKLLKPTNRDTTVTAAAFSPVAIPDAGGVSAIAISKAGGIHDREGTSLLDIYHNLLLTRKYKYAVFTLDFPAPTSLLQV
jgi:hypothetical protein